jgi:hypothetical protein
MSDALKENTVRKRVCRDPRCKPPEPPDAIERLESWLLGDQDRDAVFGWIDGTDNIPGTFTVRLINVLNPGQRRHYAKEPGLAATIHAAIDLAEKQGI